MTSRNGFSGSVTNACRMFVVIGSGTPARSATSVDQPAVGALAHVQALVLRDDEATFRVFVPQEYGHYVAEVVADAAAGVSAS